MNSENNRIYLVACVGQKVSAPASAKDLYTSSWFRKARAYVEGKGGSWFILSAKHGLVHPDQEIEPYDSTLNTMRAGDRRRWAKGVLGDLAPHLKGAQTVVFLAGLRYREFLTPNLKRRGLEISIPMEGLRIGEQMRWLSKRIR